MIISTNEQINLTRRKNEEGLQEFAGRNLFAIMFVHLITLTLEGMRYLIKFLDYPLRS